MELSQDRPLFLVVVEVEVTTGAGAEAIMGAELAVRLVRGGRPSTLPLASQTTARSGPTITGVSA